MFLKKVELENIKSYRHFTVELGPGTTAIRGQNGAGKTTLVEAIGFALFDYLPYSQQQFVREGERSGTVTVTIISGDDGCLYDVVRRCGMGACWYVYNPQMNGREAEQRTDVIDWLRRHLPLQGELELKALFADALGVPQGTFTADFLATAANRKKKFDALLQVEDYRKASDNLLHTQNYLKEQLHEQDKRKTELEGKTGALEGLRTDLANKQAERERAFEAEMLADEQRRQAEARRAELQQRAEEVKRLDGERTRAQEAWERAQQALAQAEGMLAEAQAAQRKVAESMDAYVRYNQLEDTLQAAEQERQARDGLMKQRGDVEQRLARVWGDEEHAAAELEKARAARQRMVGLAPQVRRQEELEQQATEAAQQAGRLGDITRQIGQAEKDHAQRAAQEKVLAERIATIEAQRQEAALLGERKKLVDELTLEVKQRGQWEQQLGQIRQQFQTLAPRQKKADADVAKAQADVQKLSDKQPEVERLPALELEFGEADQTVAGLRTNIKRHNESKLQSAGGQCPFLHEPCLNIRQKGQSSLEAYFEKLIERDQAALAPLAAQREGLEKQVQELRLVKSNVDRLPDYERRLHELQEQQEGLKQDAERLTEQGRELAARLSAIEAQAPRLVEAQALLKRSDEADKQVRSLEGLVSQHGQLREQLEERLHMLEALRAEQATLADAPVQAQKLQQELSELGNPRLEYAAQERLADEEEPASKALERARQTAEEAAAALVGLDAKLAPFAALDERRAALLAQREQCRVGHATYLAHQHAAQKLPECQAAWERARTAESQTQEQARGATQRYETEAAGYDPQMLEEVKQQLDSLRDDIASLRERLRHLQEAITALQGQISQTEGLLTELEKARAEYQELSEMLGMLHQFRETIKDAGPYVMKEMLKQISKVANGIFGEILGDRSAELAWEDEYEIVLRSRGQERSFAQLSGGEQMSAALAVRLALLKTLARLDVAFFDEPTQNMDDLRRGNLAEQIRRVRGFHQLFVISHDDTFEQGLDSVILLHKRDGETMLADGELALVGSSAEESGDES